MKKIWTYLAIGCVAVFVILFCYIRGDFFDNFGMYLRIILIVCAGIAAPKIISNQNDDTSDKNDN